ncbi:voltage-gated potassium channel [Bdellovibrio bacteriovorus]|uniref:Voltage-gated potassium channel n=1 Tax=Bdellovibrio bacteriovorus TaxID=959 RepID=A0A162GNS9_BDEBC|nr:aldo/keto reductase family protein [Bdellovibrio bacteriovorus]KYG68590.1 voltage-gated potassium channel [Bdellovibrio bacteriovorus]
MFNPTMPYRNAGRCGLKLSSLSLGGWTTFGGTVKDFTSVRSILRLAYEAGINFFDIADIYAKGESERIMGGALKDFPRHELVISSKVFWPMSDDINDRGLSRKHILESVNKSLQRIGTDYLDIYFCHRYDPETPVEETVRIMDDLIHHGKILYWGTSEWTAEQIQEAMDVCDQGGYYRPQIEQPQYSLLAREKFEENVRPKAQEHGMGLVTWSPLASGMLTGKYDNGISEGRLSRIDWLRETFYTEENLERVRNMKALADELGCTRGQLALAWLLNQPGMTSVILGATSIEQLQENLSCLKVPMTEDIDKSLKKLFTYS